MLRRTSDELIVRPRLSAPARLAVVLALIAVVAAASLAGYWGGQSLRNDRLDSAASRIETLEQQLRDSRLENRKQREEFEAARRKMEARFDAARESLQAEFDAAREKLVSDLRAAGDELEMTRRRLEQTKSSLTKVTRQLQIDRSAYKELRKELNASHREITELASELKFYRSIISPADGRSGVRIQKFELQPTDAEHEYRYRLILIQALEHEDNAQGIVRFEIRGSENGSSRTIHSPGESQGRISADFKYFQNFAGTFSFPGDFMPAEVKVIFEAEDDAVVQRVFPWPDPGGGQNA